MSCKTSAIKVRGMYRDLYNVAPYPSQWGARFVITALGAQANAARATLAGLVSVPKQLDLDLCRMRDRLEVISASVSALVEEPDTEATRKQWDAEVVAPLFRGWELGPIDDECLDGDRYTPRTWGEAYEIASIHNQICAALGTFASPFFDLLITGWDAGVADLAGEAVPEGVEQAFEEFVRGAKEAGASAWDAVSPWAWVAGGAAAIAVGAFVWSAMGDR